MVNKFLVPPGFKDSLNFDTFIEHQYKNSIINSFRENGFTLVKTPLIEFSKNLDSNTLTIKSNKKTQSSFFCLFEACWLVFWGARRLIV